jgi:hypothetical protein
MDFIGYFLNIYIKPYARWTPYIFGLFLGVAHSKYTDSLKD